MSILFWLVIVYAWLVAGLLWASVFRALGLRFEVRSARTEAEAAGAERTVH